MIDKEEIKKKALEIYKDLNALSVKHGTGDGERVKIFLLALFGFGIYASFIAAPSKKDAVEFIKEIVETITTKFIKEFEHE